MKLIRILFMSGTWVKRMKHRSRSEIIFDILQCAMIDTTRCKLMYRAYLSYQQIKDYISYLQENKMLDYNEKTSRYKITENGIKFLRAYEQMNGLFPKKLDYKIQMNLDLIS